MGNDEEQSFRRRTNDDHLLAMRGLWSPCGPMDRHRLPVRCDQNALADGYHTKSICGPCTLFEMDVEKRGHHSPLERLHTATAHVHTIFGDHVWHVPILEASCAPSRIRRRATFVQMLLGWRCFWIGCDRDTQSIGAVARSSANAFASSS